MENPNVQIRDHHRRRFYEQNGQSTETFWSRLTSRIRPWRSGRCDQLPGQLIPRANFDKLREIFEAYASIDRNNKKYMTDTDFVQKYLGLYTDENYNRETVRLIASAADTSKDGLISFEEFCAFEATLCAPDALYLTAFDIFDNNASESITADEFEKVIRHTTPLLELDFDFNSEFIKKYFGAKKTRQIGYLAFTQLLHDFYEEQGLQAFKKFDKESDGSITAGDFCQIMSTVKNHLLTDFVRHNLMSIAGGSTSSHKVRFPFYQAVNSLLNKMELIKRVYNSLARGNLDLKVTKEEFLHAAQSYAQITPYEVEILFHICELAHPGERTFGMEDLERIDPERLKRVSYMTRLTNIKAVHTKEDRGIGTALLESAYRFALGSIAGACGATAVYPIDLVKTRMQNQRTGSFLGEVAYKNSWDCFKKVVKFEGVLGLYRGLLPQIIGVAPEKAIKLTMNDFVRDKLTGKDGRIPLIGGNRCRWNGGCKSSGLHESIGDLAGELRGVQKVGVGSVLRELGFLGLYKGARACFLRDVPFSAIYFPAYAHVKQYTADDQGLNGPGSLFASAFIAGVPAAALVTPADVIKTRLQVAAREGQTSYNGVIDCARKVMKEEGPYAFWKGTAARVCRSSPQFAVTLLTYELLQRLFYVDFGGHRPAGSEVSTPAAIVDQASENPDHVGGFKIAAATFSGIEHKFGLFLPRFEMAKR
ncbi:Calcium-binding carrier protein Aralar1 [Aphelenchoides besseyi]|nr:Calcium-binding carrier protein Aralar1 [Aphelenchoides besseyi]